MRYISKLLVLLFFACFFENIYSQVPSITYFTPTVGAIGTTVTINGNNFDPTPTNNIVWFGAVKAAITSATSTQLTVTIPTGATYQPLSITNLTNGLTAYASKPFNVTFPSTRIIDASAFGQKVDFSSGNTPETISVSDIDGNGKVDIVITCGNSGTVSVYRNVSSLGSISTASISPKVDFPGSQPRGIAIGDIDGDGKPDLVVTNSASNTISIFRNTSTSGSISTGSFATRVELTTGVNPYGVSIGDIDGDGKPDIAITNFGDNSVSVFRNISVPGTITASSFLPKVDYLTGLSPIDVALGDMDGDGKSDMIVTNSASSSVSVFWNASTSGTINTGSFSFRNDFPVGTNPYKLAIGDIDGDGKPDLAVTNTGSNTVSLFRNISISGTFTPSSFATRVDLPTGSNPRGISFSDLDGDGKPDLIIANQFVANISVFRNISTSGSISAGSFESRIDFNTGGNPYGVTAGDVDGDGKPDLVVTNNSANTISVLRNTIPNSIPPSAPTIGTITQTNCTVSTGSVVLGGLPASGSWTITGSPGNITSTGSGTSATISALASGTYSFTVSDALGTASPASSNVTINTQPVTPSAPVLGTITQPTCPVPTGSVVLNGLPASGSWTITTYPGGGTTTGSGATSTISSLTPDTYSFTVTNASACISTSSTNSAINEVLEGVFPVITKKWKDVLICFNLNNTIKFFQWFKGNTAQTGDTKDQFYYAKNQPGIYKVLTTDNNGCKHYSNSIEITSGSKSVSAYPNPAMENVTLKLNDDPVGKAVISFYNQKGIKVIEILTDKDNYDLIKDIPLGGIDEGVYFVRITINLVSIYDTKIVVAK